MVGSDSSEGEVENPEVGNRESQLLSHIREIPVKGFKARDLTRSSQTIRKAKELSRVICCEVGKTIFPDDPHTWGQFFDNPDSVDKKYKKILNNTVDLFILGHPRMYQVCTSILASSLMNNTARDSVKERI